MQNKNWVCRKEMNMMDFLVQYSGISKKELNTLRTQGKLMVNGECIKNSKTMVYEGDILEIGQAKTNYDLPFSILYEDNYLVVIDKPAGLLTMGTDREKDKTAYHQVGVYLKKKDPKAHVFIVHRLDQDTSGVLIFAKDEKTKKLLQEHWNERVSLRQYIALVEGCPKKKKGTINQPLKESKTQMVYISKDGKEAITDYEVMVTNHYYSVIACRLRTGRKNQIRVHLSSISCPIVGDDKYGASTNPLRRLGLHCEKIKFKHPYSNEDLLIEAKLPDVFQKYLKK